MRYGHAAAALVLALATTGAACGETDDAPLPTFASHAPYFVRPCTCRGERYRGIEFGLRYKPAPQPAVQFDTDDGHTFQFLLVDAKQVGDRYIFTVPQRYEGSGVYRMRVTARHADGTWIHELDSGATVIEHVSWPLTILTP